MNCPAASARCMSGGHEEESPIREPSGSEDNCWATMDSGRVDMVYLAEACWDIKYSVAFPEKDLQAFIKKASDWRR